MSENEKEKARGPRGEVGKGTPGKRLKRAARAVKQHLRKFARQQVKDSTKLAGDASAWLASKK